TGDVSHLADVLCHVLNLPLEDLRRMHPACEQRAQDFSMGKMVERYEQLYESLTTKQP
ncbi:MAG: hypothetical protein IT324_05105, partial [Anaerolineae bacterium]|nr:hypothetical protein [Anaerolineae bacterium]